MDLARRPWGKFVARLPLGDVPSRNASLPPSSCLRASLPSSWWPAPIPRQLERHRRHRQRRFAKRYEWERWWAAAATTQGRRARRTRAKTVRGACGSRRQCGGTFSCGGADAARPCTPLTCRAEQACGTFDNGCNGTVNCGACGRRVRRTPKEANDKIRRRDRSARRPTPTTRPSP